jgi:threonine dehydrogenase-like Zn-dependent dehydrogenase
MKLPPTMRALQLQGLGQLDEVTVPLPSPRPDEVLLRTRAATICTSDLHDLRCNPFGIRCPRILGHEGAGEVTAVGEHVQDFAVGDRVAAHPVIPCGSCSNCRRGLGHLCASMGHLGLDRDGTFAEYFCLRADRLRRIGPTLDFAEGALLEPVSVCIEALERAQLEPKDALLIIGDGPFGITIARLAPVYRPKRIIMVGRHDFRLRQVRGATSINQRATADVRKAVSAATNGEGVDAAILAVGNQAALDLCLASVRARGRVVVFSAIQGQATVNLFDVHVKELSILGACNDQNHIDRALGLLSEPTLELASLITHRIPFEHWPQAFELAEKGKDSALKVALIFGAGE